MSYQNSNAIQYTSKYVIRQNNKFLCGLFTILVISGLAINRYLLFGALGTAAFFFLKCNYDEAFYFTFFLIPFIRAFDSLGFSSFINLLFLIPIIRYTIEKKFTNNSFVDFFVLATYEVFHMICYSEFKSLVINIITIMGLYYGKSITTNCSSSINKEKVAFNLSSGVLLSCICFLLCNKDFIYNWSSNLGSEIWRFKAFSGDPNALSLYSLLAISIIISLGNVDKKSLLTIVALSIIVVMTFSKMGIIVLFINLFCMCIINWEKIQKSLIVVIAPIIVIIVIYLFRNQFFSIIQGFLNRFTRGKDTIELNTLTSGRFNIDLKYFEIYINNIPLFLLGGSLRYPYYTGINHVAHNTFLDVFFSWGGIGSIIVFIIIKNWIIYFNNKKLKDKLPLITLAICFMSLSYLSANVVWIIIAGAFTSLINDKRGNLNE